MQLADLFNLSLTGRATADALDYDGPDGRVATLTFNEIDLRSNRMARLLAGRGLACGDRLGFFLPNRVEFIDLFLACVKLGVIVVPINVHYREREFGQIITDAEPKAVASIKELRSFIPEGVPFWDVEELASQALYRDGARVRAVIDGNDPAAIVYTSGTT